MHLAWLGYQGFVWLALPKSALAHQVFGPEIGAATVHSHSILTGGFLLLWSRLIIRRRRHGGHQVF